MLAVNVVEVIISWNGCSACKEIISRKPANLFCHPALSLGVQTYVAGPVWRTGYPYSRLQGPSEGQGVPPREIREEEVVRICFAFLKYDKTILKCWSHVVESLESMWFSEHPLVNIRRIGTWFKYMYYTNKKKHPKTINKTQIRFKWLRLKVLAMIRLQSK